MDNQTNHKLLLSFSVNSPLGIATIASTPTYIIAITFYMCFKKTKLKRVFFIICLLVEAAGIACSVAATIACLLKPDEMEELIGISRPGAIVLGIFVLLLIGIFNKPIPASFLFLFSSFPNDANQYKLIKA